MHHNAKLHSELQKCERNVTDESPQDTNSFICSMENNELLTADSPELKSEEMATKRPVIQYGLVEENVQDN